MISSNDLPSIAEEVKRRQEVAEGMSHTATSLELSTEVYRRLMERLPYPLSFQDYVDLVEGGLNALVNGTLVIDLQGNVIFYSKSYEDFLNIAQEEVIGRPCTNVIENTRMHIVVETGVPEVGHSHRIRARTWWSSVSPSERTAA